MTVPWEFRRRTLTCTEALLRILHQALVTYDDDLESIVIYMAVTSASVGGALRNPLPCGAPPSSPMAPEKYRAVSRRAIAASTGLPRETVRRKIAEFVARGELVAEGGGVRIRPGVLREARNLEFAETLLREFARAGVQAGAATKRKEA